MKKILLFFFVLVLTFFIGCNVFAQPVELGTTKIEKLQQYRSRAKLYAPNFVLVDSDASFRVFSSPNEQIKLVLDYGSYIKKQEYSAKTNENGVAIISVKILNEEDLVGKSVAVDAYTLSPDGRINGQAVMQTENGTASSSNRVYITDKDSAKGFMFSPWQSLNSVIMSTQYDDRSGYNPYDSPMYYDKTPVYIKNMRDAQDNVRTLPQNTDNSN